MAELADAHGSGPCDSNIMRVQVPSPALVIAKVSNDLCCAQTVMKPGNTRMDKEMGDAVM